MLHINVLLKLQPVFCCLLSFEIDGFLTVPDRFLITLSNVTPVTSILASRYVLKICGTVFIFQGYIGNFMVLFVYAAWVFKGVLWA